MNAIIVSGSAEEIAALVLAVQERQVSNREVFNDLREKTIKGEKSLLVI